jgi:hypothetical protein
MTDTTEAVERLITDLMELDVAYRMPTCSVAAYKIAALAAENAALRDEVDARIPVNLVESLVKAAEPVLVEGYESELAALRAEVERLRGAVGEIAQKKKTDELETEYDVDIADFEAGYDACIDIARAAKDAKP